MAVSLHIISLIKARLTMDDLIACLYPYRDERYELAKKVVNDPKYKSRYVPRLKEKPTLPERRSRETTAPLDTAAPLDEYKKDNTPSLHYVDGLKLTFSQNRKTGSRIVLGTDPNSCDIVVPALPFISRRHCYLTFDEHRRLVVRDCSRHGTIVTYDNEGGEKRHEFTWIISGDEVPDHTETIVIQLDKNLKFQIVVSKPTFIDDYLDNVDQFLKEAAG
jgi:hypothetical protein